jgi:hypothetical protein
MFKNKFYFLTYKHQFIVSVYKKFNTDTFFDILLKTVQKLPNLTDFCVFFGFGRKNLPIGIKLRRAFVRRVGER